MSGIHTLAKEPFEGTDLVPSSRWIRFSGVKPKGYEKFVLNGVDSDSYVPDRETGAIIADHMRDGMVRFWSPDGRFLCWGLYTPLEGNKTVNPVGNWISMRVHVSYDTPLFDVAEVNETMKSPDRFRKDSTIRRYAACSSR